MKKKKKEIIFSCPFCGSKTVEVIRTNENACWIRCHLCGGEAESHKSRTVAIKKWNRRKLPTPATHVVDIDKIYFPELTSKCKEAHHG